MRSATSPRSCSRSCFAPCRSRSSSAWAGNRRERQNVLERAVILSTGPMLHIPLGDLQAAAPQAQVPAGAPVTLADAEREHILGVLHETDWVLGGPNGAAARLGMKRS